MRRSVLPRRKHSRSEQSTGHLCGATGKQPGVSKLAHLDFSSESKPLSNLITGEAADLGARRVSVPSLGWREEALEHTERKKYAPWEEPSVSQASSHPTDIGASLGERRAISSLWAPQAQIYPQH